MIDIKVGDEVTVFGQRQSSGEGEPGTVIKVGRKLVTIRTKRRDEVFRLDTRVINDAYGRIRFETPEQAALILRERTARRFLISKGIDLSHRFRFTLEQVEALAEVARTFADRGPVY